MKGLWFRSVVFIGLSALLITSSVTAKHKTSDDIDDEEDVELSFLDLDIDNDGFKIDQHIWDSIIDENRSIKEKDKADEFERASAEQKTKNVFEKICPPGFAKCLNGECISPKWWCDGHYDCDDFSDELNCTTVEPIVPSVMDFSPKSTKSTTPKPALPRQEEISVVSFNSSIEPLILFSTGTSIRGYWMRSRVYFDVYGMNIKQAPKNEQSSITQALSVFFDLINAEHSQTSSHASDEAALRAKNTIVGLDMDPTSKEVYWVELGQDAGVYSTAINGEQFESRLRRQFNGPQRKTIVDSGLISPEDIALDTLGRNFYITDAGLPAIVVCSIKFSHCKMIVKDKLHKPRAIIADSSTGWLTYTDWGDHPGIFLVSMDGKKRETLIDTDIVWPNGLAADYAANQLYWADARLSKIERIDLTTMKRRKIITETASNPFSLSLFESRIYWSDWAGNDIRTVDKQTGNNTKNIMRVENLFGIHIYHPSLHQSHEDEDPCWSKHCSHMCLLSPPTNFARRDTRPVGAVCACPESMALSIGDRATCYEVQLSFLLVNVKNYVAQVFPEQIGLHTVQKVIYSKEHVIHDVASDWLNYRLFFFDAAKEHIYLVDLSRKTTNIDKFLENKKSIRGLLYDAWSDNLYWLETDHGYMSMCSVKAKHEKIMRKDLDRPVSLVLDSKNRVFYIATLGHVPHIMRTDIFANESSDLVIIGSDDIGLPVALHLDEQQQRLYWADARTETIESMDLDIRSPTGLKSASRVIHKGRLGTILAFTVYHNQFLWMTKNGEYLYKSQVDDHSKEQKQVSLKLPSNPSLTHVSSDNKRIIVVDPRHEIIISPCRGAGCSLGCILTANHSAICVKPEVHQDASHQEVPQIAAISEKGVHEVSHLELPHYEPPHQEAPHQETAHQGPAHQKSAEQDKPLQLDISHQDSHHVDIPHQEPVSHDISHEDGSHLDGFHPEASHHQDTARHQESAHQEGLHQEPSVHKIDNDQPAEDAESSLTWLILVLLVLIVTGLLTLALILFFFKPRAVSHILVGFRPHHDKEGSVVLLDD